MLEWLSDEEMSEDLSTDYGLVLMTKATRGKKGPNIRVKFPQNGLASQYEMNIADFFDLDLSKVIMSEFLR